jgi:hypothetical protein
VAFTTAHVDVEPFVRLPALNDAHSLTRRFQDRTLLDMKLKVSR